MIDGEDIKSVIMERMEADDFVSFVELRDALGKAGRGDVALHLGGYENIIIWSGMSEGFADAMIELLSKEGPLVLHPSSVLVYLADGAIPKIPLAKQLRHYKEPHWAPVTIRTKKRAGVKK